MKVLLIKNNRLYNYILPKEVKDNFWITDIDGYDNVRNLINIEALEGRWVLTSNYDTHIMTSNGVLEKVYLEEYQFYTIKNDSEQNYYYLYAISDVEKTYKAYNVASSASFYIGSAANNNIIYQNPLVNEVHAKLDYNNGLWQIADNNSSTGVYVNDQKINKIRFLSYGDIIFISGLKVIVMRGFLLINDINGKVKVNSQFVALRDEVHYQVPTEEVKDDDLNRSLYAKEEYFYRSPRFIEDIVKAQVNFDSPPGKITQDETSLIMVFGPMFTMAISSFMTIYSTINNINSGNATWESAAPSLLLGGSMLASMLVWPLVSRHLERQKREKKEKERVEKYTQYLDEKRKEIDAIISDQSQTLKDKYISLQDCANIIIRKRSNLWERSIDQNDFLALRLGIGNMPICAEINYPKEGFTMEEDELRKKIKEIVDERQTLTNVPINYSLVEKNITSIIGNNQLLHDFFKGQLLQLVTFHSYEFLKIVVLTNKENASDFEYMHNIPYLFDDGRQTRFFATDLDETKELSLYLERIFQDRKSNKRKFTDTPPYFVIVTDNYHMYRDIEIIKDILDSEENFGFSLVIFSEKIQNLPSECKNFVNVNPERSGIFESEISVGNQREFQTEFCNGIDVNDCLRRISNIPIEINSDDKALPNSVTFLEMYNVGKVEQLNILQRYQNNNSQKSLAVPVGIEKSGGLLKLDLHEKYHGPHGLIAGMTGSGKSEFIITYILSMTVNFSPEDIAFILIDYKGGGLAGAFENRETGVSLPHLAGTITNLDVSEMNRSLSSIQSELRRRQQLFNDARDKLGESTVDIYKYQKFYKEGKVSEAVPHLFIISDEFAELKSQQPEFMDQLISTARIGRSLGVHLILATQKPSGVVNDQIWSNTRFRVCLKVQEKGDSNEMIKTPDAAFLKQAGRFFLQVGYNELFALGQSGWAGAQYYPMDKLRKKVDQSVVIIDNIGNVIGQYDDLKEVTVKSSGEELNNVLMHIIDVCQNNKLKANKLWLEKILPDIYVDNLVKKYSYEEKPFVLRPIIGEFDDPNNQRQSILYLNLSKDGNTAIYGSAGNGKELLFSTVIYSLITMHTPEEVNIYVMDFGSGTLGNYRRAPHVGDIILPTEEEKINNSFRMLEQEIENRKKLFIDYNGDYQNYVARSGKTLPYILFFINNYDVFQDTFDFEEVINRITRECSKYGIIIIASVNTTGGMRYKLRQNFHSDIALQFNDQDDYSMIVGNTKKLFPSPIYGRGLVKLDNVYEFQTAHIFKDEEYNDKIKEVIDALNKKYPNKAPKIPVVPEVVYIDDVISTLDGMKNVPVGINRETIAPEVYSFKDNYATLVLANEECNELNEFTVCLVELFSMIDRTSVLTLDVDNVISGNYRENVSYLNDGFDEVIKKLCDSMEYQYNQYVQDGYSTRNIQNNQNIVTVIMNFSKLLLRIDANLKKRFTDLLEKCKDIGQFDFVLVDRAESIKKLEYDSWYKATINNSYGIWIGNGVADQTVIKTNIGFKKVNNEVPVGYGVVVKNTKTELVNMLQKNNSVSDVTNNTEVETMEVSNVNNQEGESA